MGQFQYIPIPTYVCDTHSYKQTMYVIKGYLRFKSDSRLLRAFVNILTVCLSFLLFLTNSNTTIMAMSITITMITCTDATTPIMIAVLLSESKTI